MKKLLLLFLLPQIIFAYQAPKELTLNIQFDSAPDKKIYGQAVHINKIITIGPDLQQNNIVAAQSEIVKNFPVTLAMLVKPAAISDEQTSLEFNFVHYGYLKTSTLVLQPRIVLHKGESGEISTDLFKLKVSANW